MLVIIHVSIISNCFRFDALFVQNVGSTVYGAVVGKLEELLDKVDPNAYKYTSVADTENQEEANECNDPEAIAEPFQLLARGAINVTGEGSVKKTVLRFGCGTVVPYPSYVTSVFALK